MDVALQASLGKSGIRSCAFSPPCAQQRPGVTHQACWVLEGAKRAGQLTLRSGAVSKSVTTPEPHATRFPSAVV